MARRRVNTTRYEIVQVASKLFLEKGYSATSPKMVCDELDISTGNLTYYFPTKEHLLSVVVEMLCDFQRVTMDQEAREGHSSLMAICLELTAMAAMCEEDEIAKDLYIAAYTSPMSLEIIRQNDAKRAKTVFKEFCPEWTDENFVEAEVLASGIEYATLMTTGDVSLEMRIAGAINNILTIYNVPAETRRMKIEKVLAMDYRAIGRGVLDGFRRFVEESNDQLLEELLRSHQRA